MFFFGRKLQKATVSAVCVGAVALAFLFSCFAVWQYTEYAHENPGKPYQTVLYTWLGTAPNAGDTASSIPAITYLKRDGTPAAFQADAGFLLDPLSAIWLLFVTGVGMLIHIYSVGYMSHEGGYYRFFGYLNLFMFSMLTLILANNYVLMFVGWEGVGLCSYLLIGFYFQRHSATTAANKAFIVNRIGDAGFLLGMFTIAWYFGSLRFTDVNSLARSGHFAIGDPIITAATLLLFVGACGKIRAASALRLATGRHGRSDAGFSIDPRRNHGHGGRLHGGAVECIVRACAHFHEDGRHCRRTYGDFCRDDCAGAERHQARARVFHRLTTWIHVSRLGSRRIHSRRLPRIHTRFL